MNVVKIISKKPIVYINLRLNELQFFLTISILLIKFNPLHLYQNLQYYLVLKCLDFTLRY